MLPTYQHNTQANVEVIFPTTPDGATIAPTAARFVVTDEVGSVVIDDTVLDLSTVEGNALTIGVNPEFNVVDDDKVRAMRVLTVTFTAPTGTHTATVRYVVEKASLLVTMTNSFQTFDEALLNRMDLPGLDGWDMADEAMQIPALVTAHDRMCRLSYRYTLDQNAVMYDARDPYWIVTGIRSLTPADYAKWPVSFRRALHRAQLYEADQILKGDPVGDKRRAGVVSETIGEAKMFFNARPPLKLALCVSAMECLSGHLHSSRRIGRG